MRTSEPLPSGVVDRLELDGLVRRDGGRCRTTRRWQGAMARAAYALQASDEPFDLRLPIAHALVDLYGSECPDAELAGLVAAMVLIEAAELEPAASPPALDAGG